MIVNDKGESVFVDETDAEVADRAARQAFAASLKAAETARDADLDLVRKADAGLAQLQTDLQGIDTMTAAQVRDVVKHLLIIEIGVIKALKRIL